MARRPDRISAIAVRGFKSIGDEQRIEVRPLTILAGANSSGKSSIMQPLLLLKQTLEAQGDPGGALQLDGTNVRFTSADQILHRRLAKPNQADFLVRIEKNDGPSLELVFRREEGKGFDIDTMTYKSDEQPLVLRPGMRHEDIVANLPRRAAILMRNGSRELRKLRWRVERERCFLALAVMDAGESPLPFFTGGLGISPGSAFTPLLLNVIHLPGLRGNPSRTYPKASAGPMFPGTFEQYTASMVAKWQEEKDPRLADLGSMLEEMGLTWKVAATPIADTQYELRVARLLHGRKGSSRDLVSIADVGFGVSQTLPVLVALLAAVPGQLVYLEQPEIHLHPRAQRKLAHVLATVIGRGVVVVVETHSSLLLREVQTLVARGELAKEKVRLNWFQRCEDGTTVVQPADLDANGAFGDWPVDFDSNELEAESAYLDAVEAREAGQ